MQVVIHADASTGIGAGHVVRSLALAAALRDLGARVILASDQLPASFTERAARVGVDVVDRRMAPRDPDWVVVDGYHLADLAPSAIANPGAKRALIVDFGGDVRNAAIVVDPNLDAHALGYPSDPERLAGPAYALLRAEFAESQAERGQPEIADRILVTLGGADPRDATRLVVAALAEADPQPQVRVVIGAAHPAPDQVEADARAAGFEAIRDASSMAPHLAWADLVISGCGSGVLEAARLGRPLLGIVLADNQRRVAAAVLKGRLGLILGEHPGITADDVIEGLGKMRMDRRLRDSISRRGPDLVDGHGALRVARALTTGPLGLRTAALDDADRLLEWRNDRSSREASFDPRPIDRSTHFSWLEARLSSSGHHIWIGELAGKPIGVVRFAIEGPVATASVALDAEWRGQGVGTRLISTGCARLREIDGSIGFQALIRPGNRASLRAFQLAGFEVGSVEPDRLRMHLNPKPVG